MFTDHLFTKKFAFRKASLTVLTALLTLLVFLGPLASSALAKQDKVSICHLDDEGNYIAINVAEPSLDAHLDHGDLVVGEDVDENCEPLVVDSDGDGVADDEDNCVDTPNPGQEDTYGSSAGDACEDSDGDGTPDAEEANFCVSIDGVLLISQGTATCESTATEGADSNVAIANGNYATAIASREMVVFGARPSNNLNAKAVGENALAWARAGENLTATAEGERAFAVSHSGTNSSATAIGYLANAQVFFGDNNHASATAEASANSGNGNNNTSTASGAGSYATSGYGNDNMAESSSGERAQAWFASNMSATSLSVYTCTNENFETAVDEDKCS